MMRCLPAMCVIVAALSQAFAQEPPSVLISDQPPQVGIAGPGAPTHIIGLERYSREIVMDTGVKQYGLQYCIARDKNRPGVAIPGEGYIGMPHPTGANWYAGGFFDLQINGQTIGTVPLHSQTGRSSGSRGCVDFVFDTPMSVVRLRFVTLAGGDVLYCQALLEPKIEIMDLRLNVRCYPSGFITNGDRHVLTPTRDIPQGRAATLDLATEYWLLYYDQIFDAGYTSPTVRGEGPCAVLFPGSQADKVGFTVGGYGIDTNMTLKPALRDFRFVFFDYKGTRNEAAMADLRQRAPGLLQELTTFAFTDPTIAAFPLAQKQEEVTRALALVPEEQRMAANYARWAVELDAQLKLIRSGVAGAIMAEAEAARIISDWERGLPELKLKALLRGI